MSTFCGGTPGSVPSYSPEDWMATFSDSNGGNGILPTVMPTMTNGLADDTWIQSYIKQLQDRNIIPRAPEDLGSLPSNMYNSPDTKDPIASFVQKDNAFQNSVKAEYCFYEGRYFSALDAFLQAVASSSLAGNKEDQSNVQGRLNATKTLNQKLTLLIQIVNGASIYKYDTAQRYQSGINSVNGGLQQRQIDLQRQNAILQKQNATLDINRRMVEYTAEKNRANNNLLTIYGVLNIVALAMVFYVART